MKSDNDINETLLVLSEATQVLEELSLPYYISGSIASSARGEFRTTNDIDIVCKFREDKIKAFIVRVEKPFYADEVAIPEAIRSHRSFNIIHRETFIKVDFFTKVREFEELEFERATPLVSTLHGGEAKVATSENIIIAKLRWWQKSNRMSDRQLRDVRGVIALNLDRLDKEYLQKMGGAVRC